MVAITEITSASIELKFLILGVPVQKKERGVYESTIENSFGRNTVVFNTVMCVTFEKYVRKSVFRNKKINFRYSFLVVLMWKVEGSLSQLMSRYRFFRTLFYVKHDAQNA
jgi:hypothetical protein